MTYTYNMRSRQVTAVTSSNVQDSEACNVVGATHVVTEVKYGFNAFLVFETEKSESYSKQEIAGTLDILIKKIQQTVMPITWQVAAIMPHSYASS